MREILFKAKRVDNGKWIEGSVINLDPDSGYCYIVPMCEGASTLSAKVLITSEMALVDPETLCQFTGMTDKNGNKVWENDISRYEWGGETRIDIIKYEPPIFTYSNSMRWNLNQDEVLGNIFDNPELLQEVLK